MNETHPLTVPDDIWNAIVDTALEHGRDAAALVIIAQFQDAHARATWLRMLDHWIDWGTNEPIGFTRSGWERRMGRPKAEREGKP